MAKDIHSAAGYGTAKEVSRLLKQGVSVDLADHQGATPLARAARFGHLEVAELLVTSGATVDHKDSAARTALHLAASNGYEPVLQLLIRSGANMEATDERGETPLMYAAGQGQYSTVHTLIRSGAKVNAQDNHGYTAIVHSFLIVGSDYAQRLDVTRLLIASGANVTLRDREGKTAVDLAEGIDHDPELLAILQQAAGAPVIAQRWDMVGGQTCVLCDKLKRWTPSKTHPDYISPDFVEEWIGTSLPGRVKNGPGTMYRGKRLIKLQILEAWHGELCDRSLSSNSAAETDTRKGGARGSP